MCHPVIDWISGLILKKNPPRVFLSPLRLKLSAKQSRQELDRLQNVWPLGHKVHIVVRVSYSWALITAYYTDKLQSSFSMSLKREKKKVFLVWCRHFCKSAKLQGNVNLISTVQGIS